MKMGPMWIMAAFSINFLASRNSKQILILMQLFSVTLVTIVAVYFSLGGSIMLDMKSVKM